MNKIKIITTIVLFFNVVFSSFIVFAESNYPIATVDNKFCFTMSDVTQNCKDGSVITVSYTHLYIKDRRLGC